MTFFCSIGFKIFYHSGFILAEKDNVCLCWVCDSCPYGVNSEPLQVRSPNTPELTSLLSGYIKLVAPPSVKGYAPCLSYIGP